MIPEALLLRLVASFVAGFAIVALVTTLADMFGEGPAGFLGGLPSTGAVSFLAIGITQSPAAAIRATTLFPLGFSVTIAFLLFYSAPRGMRFGLRMALALGLWFFAASAVATWSPDDFAFSVVASVAISMSVLLARSRVNTRKTAGVNTRPSALGVVLRGALGGCVVDVVVILSVVSGPLVGGVFAAAPAIWSSSLYVTNRAQGMEFSRSLTWTFMQTGFIVTIPFAIAARYLFSVSGVWWGTLLTYVAVSPLAYLAWRLANRRSTRGAGLLGRASSPRPSVLREGQDHDAEDDEC